MQGNNSKEEWKQIPEYPNYMLSTKGRLYSSKTKSYIKGGAHNSVVISRVPGESHSWSIHALMGCTFLGNDINDPYRNRVLFKDKDSSHLDLDNLYVEDTSDLPGEVWKGFTEFNGNILQPYYQVSNKGRVKSIKHSQDVTYRGKKVTRHYPELIMQPDISGDYAQAMLYTLDGKSVSVQVHRMVAFSFIYNDQPDLRKFVNHIDGNKQNNHVENLEWCTASENQQHAVRTGLRDNAYHERLRHPVIRLETMEFYESISAACRAMGRSVSYYHIQSRDNNPLIDINGNTWTLEVHEDWKQRIYSDGKACYFEEYPDQQFISMLVASEFIHRNPTYIADCIYTGLPILDQYKRELHLHFIDSELEAQCRAGQMIKQPKVYQGRTGRKYVQGQKQLLTLEEYSYKEFEGYTQLSRFLRKAPGYVCDCVHQNTPLKDQNGRIVHMHFVDLELEAKFQAGEFIDEAYRNKGVYGKRKKFRCYFEENPELIFNSTVEASRYLNKAPDYVLDRSKYAKPMLDANNNEFHFHYIDPEKEAELQTKYAEASTQNKSKNRKLFNID